MISSRFVPVYLVCSILILSLAGAGTAVAAGSPATAVPSPAPASAAAAEGLTVMTINLEHHDKPEEMKAMAENLKTLKRLPDFILCQEVYFERHGSKDHPQDNTAAVFADYLGYYCKGTKRTSDREGIAIISKYPFDYYDSINLKSQTLRILLGFRRVSVMAEFTVPGVGKVRVTDTHLTNWPFETHVRNKQIAETLQWIADREKAAPAALNFFGGDFNAKIDWSEMDQVKLSAAHGSVPYHNFNGSEYTQGSHGSPDKRIDFIFVAASGPLDNVLRFTGEQLLWKEGLHFADGGHFYPSDHLGVIHTYAFGRQAPITPQPQLVQQQPPVVVQQQPVPQQQPPQRQIQSPAPASPSPAAPLPTLKPGRLRSASASD
jgi:endonuclease/exonuclease/phosphatase family metal-dependent hydrolase